MLLTYACQICDDDDDEVFGTVVVGIIVVPKAETTDLASAGTLDGSLLVYWLTVGR